MPDRRGCRRANPRRQCGGEDKAGRIGAHRVYQIALAGDVAAEAAERLRKCPLDNIDTAHNTVALGYPAAARTVHTDCVDLVDISESTIALSEIANPVQRS